ASLPRLRRKCSKIPLPCNSCRLRKRPEVPQNYRKERDPFLQEATSRCEITTEQFRLCTLRIPQNRHPVGWHSARERTTCNSGRGTQRYEVRCPRKAVEIRDHPAMRKIVDTVCPTAYKTDDPLRSAQFSHRGGNGP